MAQAPILSSVSRSSPHRSICAGVPRRITVPAASPVVTPSAVTIPGQRRELDDGDERHRRLARAAAVPVPAAVPLSRPLPGPLALERPAEALPGELVQPEGGVELPDDVVGGQVAVLQVVQPGVDLLVDEPADRVADRQVLVAPLEHGYCWCRETSPWAPGASTRWRVFRSVCSSTSVTRLWRMVVVSS